jgi:hypothetical protein
MSGQGKLDQSLDEIMKDTKPTRAGRGRGPRRAAAVKAAAATAAPAGGVAKKTKAPRGPKAAAPAAAAIPTTGESKIIVSGLVSFPLPQYHSNTTNKFLARRRERGADQGMLIGPDEQHAIFQRHFSIVPTILRDTTRSLCEHGLIYAILLPFAARTRAPARRDTWPLAIACLSRAASVPEYLLQETRTACGWHPRARVLGAVRTEEQARQVSRPAHAQHLGRPSDLAITLGTGPMADRLSRHTPPPCGKLWMPYGQS